MPRLARLDAPGVLHHIMIRGIGRRKIFFSNKDREDFLERLSKLLPETKTACYAWVFIPNHAHFLFRADPTSRAILLFKKARAVLSLTHKLYYAYSAIGVHQLPGH